MKSSLVDTHCHIHEADYPLDAEEVLAAARAANVDKLIVVGTDITSSRAAAEFASNHDNVWAIIGVHPHEAKTIAGPGLAKELNAVLASPVHAKKIVGIGEIGLDYYYNHSPRATQIEALNQQIELAVQHNLPISFHVREAFSDFWPIYDNFGGQIRGVLHSYTDDAANMKKALSRGLFIGVNGIATFNKNPEQEEVYAQIPLGSLLLETDAPWLTPVPFRGQPNQPAFIPKIVEFLAELRGETYDKIANQTTESAEKLFQI
jgi:TatD DNase family protein